MAWQLPKTLTRTNAKQLLTEGLEKIAQGEMIFDAQLLEQFDSSALALFLAWQRSFNGDNRARLILQHVPEKLVSLAKVYGVSELLQL